MELVVLARVKRYFQGYKIVEVLAVDAVRADETEVIVTHLWTFGLFFKLRMGRAAMFGSIYVPLFASPVGMFPSYPLSIL